MQNRVDPRIAQQALHAISVGVAADDRGGLIRDRVGVSRGEVVQDDDTMPGGDQGIDTRSADVSSPTRYQDCAWL